MTDVQFNLATDVSIIFSKKCMLMSEGLSKLLDTQATFIYIALFTIQIVSKQQN